MKLIKAGTLEKLVESLASDSGELESTYVNVFLATYRTFSTATQVLSLISDRYKELGESSIEETTALQFQKCVLPFTGLFLFFTLIRLITFKFS